MHREALQQLVWRDAPAVDGTRARLDFVGQKTGQLFGWITGPDQQFIGDWLPEVSAAYPRKPMRIVEVGTFGGSTARGLIVFSGGGEIVCIDNMVDVHQGARGHHPSGRAFWEDTLKNNGADLSSYATLIEGDSAAVGAGWKLGEHETDLLLVDGDHHEEPAYTDMRLFAAHVVKGGYCLVDDMDMPEVVRASDRFFNSNEWRVVRRPSGDTSKIIAYQRM